MKSLLASQAKRGQLSLNLLVGLVMAVAALIIGIIIALVITSTVKDAGLLTSTRTSTTVTNETGWLNISNYTLAGEKGSETLGFTITAIWGNTPNQALAYNYSIALANATLNSDTGVVGNSTAVTNSTIYNNVTFTYNYKTFSSEEFATDNLSANFTKGINNVSGKIPTVLLIAVIILVIGALAVLVGVWQRMRMGGGASL